MFLAFGLGLLGLVLCVVPWTQASSRNEYVGQGSTSISQRSLDASPDDARSPATPPAPGRGVLARSGGGADDSVPKSLRNPYNDGRSGGDTMDWTHLPTTTPRHFSLIVGDVDGLYPGRDDHLWVTFVNGQDFDLLVHDAVVTATGTPQCGSANLDLSSLTFSVPILVPARSSLDRPVPFGLRASAPDACQGATFTVTVTSKASAA